MGLGRSVATSRIQETLLLLTWSRSSKPKIAQREASGLNGNQTPGTSTRCTRAQAVRSLLSPQVSAEIFAFSYGSTPVPPPIPRQVRQRVHVLGLDLIIDHYEDPSGEKRST